MKGNFQMKLFNNTLPKTRYVRIWQIIGDKKADPPIPPIIPVSKSTWWAGVKSGKYPQPVKLGLNTTAWKVEDIYELVKQIGENTNEKV